MNSATLNIAIKVDDQGSIKIEQVGKTARKAGDEADAGFRKAKRSLGDFNDRVGKTLGSVEALYAAIAGAAALTMLVKVSSAAVKAASDLEEVSSKFNVVFKGQEQQAARWSETLVNAYAMSTRESKQYLSSVQDLLVPMGMAAEQAGKMSFEVVKLSADLGSFNNLPTSQVMDDIQSALVGNYETMKKYGVVLNATTVQQKAMDLGLAATVKELTAADKAQAAYKLIVEGSTAAIGDMNRTQGSYANQLKKSKALVEDLKATLGSALLPAVTKLVSEFNSWITVNQKLIEQDLEGFGDKVAQIIKQVGEMAAWTYQRIVTFSNSLAILEAVKNGELDFWKAAAMGPKEAAKYLKDVAARQREFNELLHADDDIVFYSQLEADTMELENALAHIAPVYHETSSAAAKAADDQCASARKSLSCAEKRAREEERIGREMMRKAAEQDRLTDELQQGLVARDKEKNDAILADLDRLMDEESQLWEGEAEEVSQLNELLVNDLGRIFDDYISDILHGQIDDIGDLFEGLFDSIVEMFMRMVAQMAANSLVEAIFGSGSSGGMTLGGAIGALFGGGSGGGGAIGTGASLISGASTVSGWFGGPTIGGAVSSAAGSLGLGGQTVIAPYVAGGTYQTLGSAGVTTAAASASASATSAAVADGVATGMSNWAADAAALNAAESSMLASGSSASAGAGASMGASAGSMFGAVGTAGFFVLPILKSLGAFDDGLQLYTHELESMTGRVLTLTTVAESQGAADARFADPAWVQAQLGMVRGHGANAVGYNAFVPGQGYVNTPLANSVAGAYQARQTDTHRLAADTESGSEAAAGVEKIADDLYLKLHDVYTALEIDATQYGDTLANTALHMADSLPAFDAYVDAVTGVDVSLGDSTSMMQMASQAADGNSTAFFNLVSALEAQGMSTQAATETASEMAAVMYNVGDAALATAGSMAAAAATIGGAASMSADWQAKAAAMAAAPQYGYHAAGGIMTRPTVFHVGGEAGAEAIAPLHDGPDTLRKMHQDIKASKNVNVQVFIGARQLKKDVVVMVDEHVAARAQAGLTTERVAYR